MRKIYSYLERTQIPFDEEDHEKWFRHVSKGGWPFSTAAHGWPISDCTSEGLKAVLVCHDPAYSHLLKGMKRIDDERLKDAINVILELHNSEGGESRDRLNLHVHT
jgi:squalene cyclase